MLDAVWNQNHLACVDFNVAVTQFHQKRPLHDQKEFIFEVVMMPDKISLELDKLDRALIDHCRDARVLIVENFGEGVGDGDFWEHQLLFYEAQ